MYAVSDICLFVCLVSGVVSTMAESDMFNGPIGVSVDSSGTVYVGDSDNHRIRKISTSGNSL